MYKWVVICMYANVPKCTSICAKFFYWMKFTKKRWTGFRCLWTTFTFVRYAERLWNELI